MQNKLFFACQVFCTCAVILVLFNSVQFKFIFDWYSAFNNTYHFSKQWFINKWVIKASINILNELLAWVNILRVALGHIWTQKKSMLYILHKL